MKKFDVKVSNPSKYWTDFESELSANFHIKWFGKTSISKFISNEVYFFKKYVSLCNKFGFAIPINCNEDNVIELYQHEKQKNKTQGMSAWYFMFYMYTCGKDLVYPSRLFIHVNDTLCKNIVNVDPISEFKHLEVDNLCFAPPFKVELREKKEEIILTCHIDNDIFNSWIDNKKTKSAPEIGGKDLWVDNSELAILNTPRLNSFLRDLKRLCFDYGSNVFEFENLGLNDFCEEGVEFDKKVVYYESIEDELKPHQRVVYH